MRASVIPLGKESCGGIAGEIFQRQNGNRLDRANRHRFSFLHRTYHKTQYPKPGRKEERKRDKSAISGGVAWSGISFASRHHGEIVVGPGRLVSRRLQSRADSPALW